MVRASSVASVNSSTSDQHESNLNNRQSPANSIERLSMGKRKILEKEKLFFYLIRKSI
jgi:hypothetical protein